MDVIFVSPALVTRKFNVNLEGPFFELRVSLLDNSNMASYHESHMVSNDGDQSARYRDYNLESQRNREKLHNDSLLRVSQAS